MNLFSQYNWFEMWGPVWFLVLLFVAILYLRKSGSSPGQKTTFLAALALIYVAAGSPFQIFADQGLFSAYATQQCILYLVVPPFLIYGTPISWLRPQLWRHSLKKTLRVLTYPWLTAILFNVGFSIYLLPFVFNSVHGHPLYNGLCELFLFLAAVLMWWSVLSPLPELNPLSEMQRVFYLFITALMLTPIAFLLLFANEVLYPAYVDMPEAFSFWNAIYDQEIAGGILKGFQLTAYGIELCIVVNQWMKKEKQGDKKQTRVKNAH